jgi:AraC-like DNA-binding protein
MLLLFYEDGSMTAYNIEKAQVYYQTKAYGDEFREDYRSTSLVFLHEKGLYQIRNGMGGSILLHFDIQDRTWQTIMQYGGYLSSISYLDHKLYIGAQVGYFTYDLGSGQIEHVAELTLYGGRKLTTDVNALEFDRQGGMWIGTQSRGLLYARYTDAPFKSILSNAPEAQNYIDLMKDRRGIAEFNGIKANVLFIDSRRWTWVGTSTGLQLYKSPKEQPVTLTRKDGLLNNIIHSIIEDDMKNIWVSTSYGISCIQIERGEVRYVTSFNNDDNVPNETFMNGKVLKLEDGTIVMQGLDHVVIFNPAEFKDILAQEPIQMSPKLTSLLVNGSFVSVGANVDGNVILEKAITRTRELNLNYDQNTISLTFSALNYSRPLQTFYRVRIPELDNGWREYSYYMGGGFVDTRGLLHLPMVGLLPGTYHVELQASNVDGKWVGEPLVWVIRVNEPWWRTTGLILFLGTVLLFLLGVNFYLFNRNTRLRVRRNSNEGDIVSRIRNFVERCNEYEFEVMGILKDGSPAEKQNSNMELSNDFVTIMERVLPYVNEHKDGRVSFHELVELTSLDVKTFYQVLAANLFKSPRMLVLKLRLQKAQQLLKNTDMPLEEIAEQCLFASPNFFISSFYHQFKMTPREYRLTT